MDHGEVTEIRKVRTKEVQIMGKKNYMAIYEFLFIHHF